MESMGLALAGLGHEFAMYEVPHALVVWCRLDHLVHTGCRCGGESTGGRKRAIHANALEAKSKQQLLRVSGSACAHAAHSVS
jgi:hypothetical protein